VLVLPIVGTADGGIMMIDRLPSSSMMMPAGNRRPSSRPRHGHAGADKRIA
jgi:hypothetical protein